MQKVGGGLHLRHIFIAQVYSSVRLPVDIFRCLTLASSSRTAAGHGCFAGEIPRVRITDGHPGKGSCRWLPAGHSRPQRPRSFWSAPRIATSGQVRHRKSATSSLCACLESSLTDLIGSGLNLLCLQSHSKPECHRTWPAVAILGADQKERSLWGRECRQVGAVRQGHSL